MAKSLLGRLNGQSEVVLDAKSRFTIRPEWRRVSMDYTLRAYPERRTLVAYLPGAYERDVAKKSKKLMEKPPYDARRLAVHSYENVKADKMGRILVPPIIVDQMRYADGTTLSLRASGNCIVIVPKKKARKSRARRKR